MEPRALEPDNITRFRLLPYKGAHTYYYAGFYGRIMSFDARSRKWLIKRNCYSNYSPAARAHRKGKLYGRTFHRGALSGMLIHRLIACVWCPCPDMFHLQVDHIDNNKFNNRADNLRWCTNLENARYAAAIRSGKTIITNLQKSLFYVD